MGMGTKRGIEFAIVVTLQPNSKTLSGQTKVSVKAVHPRLWTGACVIMIQNNSNSCVPYG